MYGRTRKQKVGRCLGRRKDCISSVPATTVLHIYIPYLPIHPVITSREVISWGAKRDVPCPKVPAMYTHTLIHPSIPPHEEAIHRPAKKSSPKAIGSSLQPPGYLSSLISQFAHPSIPILIPSPMLIPAPPPTPLSFFSKQKESASQPCT